MKYYKNLDGLRGVAVLMVLVAHYPLIEDATIFNKGFSLLKQLGSGYLGVEIFFVLSGFLITTILLSELKKGKERVLSRFYFKRCFRIFPVVIASVALCFVLFDGYNYVYIFLFSSNYYFAFLQDPHPLRHFWSLAVEEQFYLVWPIAVMHFGLCRKTMLRLILASALVYFIFLVYRGVIDPSQLNRSLIYRSLETRMLALILGGAMAIWSVPKFLPVYSLSLVLLFKGAIFSCLYLNSIGYALPVAAIKSICYMLMAVVVFSFCYHSDGLIRRFFESRLLVLVGIVSYGIYAYHLPILFYFGISHMQTGGNSVPLESVLLSLCSLFAIVFVSWHCMERPLLSFKDKFHG